MLQNEEVHEFYSMQNNVLTFYGRWDGWDMRKVEWRRHIQCFGWNPWWKENIWKKL